MDLNVTQIAQALIDELNRQMDETPAMVRGIVLLHDKLIKSAKPVEVVEAEKASEVTPSTAEATMVESNAVQPATQMDEVAVPEKADDSGKQE